MTGAFHFIPWHPFHQLQKALHRLLQEGDSVHLFFLKRKYLPLDLLQMEQDEEESVQEVRLAEREPNPKWSLFPKITTVLH